VRLRAITVMLAALCSASVQAAEPTAEPSVAWPASLLPLPEGGWERLVTQSEYDCVRSFHRDIASTGYSGNNLSGDRKQWVAERPSLWTPIVPDTVGEAIGRELCARTKQRSVKSAPPN